MTGLAQLERQALCTILTSVGPDAPTLCEGWTTRDLAAHLVIRERRPDAAAGLVIKQLADRAQAVQEQYAATDWDELVAMIREGAPGWSPTRVPAVDDAVNFAEYFVHLEDVLRAAPDWTGEASRVIPEKMQDAVWARLRQLGQLLFRRSPVGVVLNPTDSAERGTRSVHGPTQLGTVTLSGLPSELLLFGFGRQGVAQVSIEGEPAAVEAVRSAKLSI